MPFAQVVLGSAGSGKTTYCVGMQQFLSFSGRHATVINLDPSNDVACYPYPCSIDIRELVDVFIVCESENLGPNGALLWALEHVWSNIEWLIDSIQKLKLENSSYLIIDCPGQIELYCNSKLMHKIIQKIEESLGISPVIINLIDSVHCRRISSFVATMCASFSLMVSFDYPFIQVLSKADLLEFDLLPANLDTYTSCSNLAYFLRAESEERRLKFLEKLAEFIEESGMMTCSFLDIQDKTAVSSLLERIECVNGYGINNG